MRKVSVGSVVLLQDNSGVLLTLAQRLYVLYYKLQYFGEIKNELFFKNEARNFKFWTTSPIWLGDGSGESSYPYNHVK